MRAKPKRIVIIGAGFAGIWAAMGAAAQRVSLNAEQELEITVVAPGEDLIIRPRLYERDLRGTRVPLHGLLPVLRVNHLDAIADRIFFGERQLQVVGIGIERRIGYDQLIICSGSRRGVALNGHGNYGVDNHAEAAALQHALDRHGSRRPRVAVIGSAFTGLEVATALAQRADVALIERQSQIAPSFGPAARKLIEAALESLNIEVHRNSEVFLDDDGQAVVRSGRELDVDLIVWATGLQAWNIANEAGFKQDGLGRIPVDETLATGVAGIWAAGDCAQARVDGQHLAPMSCQHAMPMGARAGANAARAAFGLAPDPYSQPFYLTCLDLGGAGALLTAGFERDDVLASGESAKAFKRYINRHVIYPPAHDADALLKLGAAEPANAAAAALQRTALRSSIVRRTLTASARDRADDHLTT